MPSEAERFLAGKACSDASEANLLALNGGKFFLETDQDWASLRRAAAKDHFQGTRNFLVEGKTPVFKLFFDIDFAHDSLGLDYVMDTLLPGILRGVDQAIARKVVHQDVVVATSPPKPKGQLTKTGVHLHWHQIAVDDISIRNHLVHLAVDSVTAMAIRSCVLCELRQLPDQGLSLDDVVDERVLKQNGLRMLFSSKCSPCDECLAQRKEASKQHPCEHSPKSRSFWKCACPGCSQARTLFKVIRQSATLALGLR